MKEMTTAEFAKANLAALEEPVRIRRYTKSVGTYYPEGFEAAAPGAVNAVVTMTEIELEASQRVIEEKNEEIARLKKELAARKLPAVAPTPVAQHPMKDAFAGLAKQDREFFERKLGKPGKSK